MHNPIDVLIEEFRKLRADVDLAGKYEALTREVRALRIALEQSAELEKLAQRVSGVTSTVAQGSDDLQGAVDANKPE